MYFVCYFLQMESKLVENEGAYSSMGENYEKRLSEQQTAQKKQSIKFQEQETSLLDQLASTKKTLISLSEEFNKGKKLSEEHRDKIQRLETNIAQAGSDKDVLETKLQENLAEINMFQQKISPLSQELDDMEKHIRDLSVLTLKHTVKHEHTPVWLTTQQRALLAVWIGLTYRDNQSDQYGEDQSFSARIMITITLSW
jgi:chromosome segregation ATPase